MKFLIAVLIILGSVFCIQGEADDKSVVFGLNDYSLNTLNLQNDSNRQAYYLSCIYIYYRLESQFDKDTIDLKDKLSNSEGACIGSLTKDLKDSTKVNNISQTPGYTGCLAGASTFYNIHMGGTDRNRFLQFTANICN